jgi:hypothetical protein
MPRKRELIEPNKGDKRYIRVTSADASKRAMSAARCRRTGAGSESRGNAWARRQGATGRGSAENYVRRMKRSFRRDHFGPA